METCDILILFIMIFLHIVDDFYLQGWLASAKQKSWWKENAPDEMYKEDYLFVLFIHGFSWSFMFMIPALLKSASSSISSQYWTCVALIINMTIHAIIDDEKANKKTINLWQDQVFHLVQILITWFIFICIL